MSVVSYNVLFIHSETQGSEKEKLFPAVNIVKRYIKDMPCVFVVMHALGEERYENHASLIRNFNTQNKTFFIFSSTHIKFVTTEFPIHNQELCKSY